MLPPQARTLSRPDCATDLRDVRGHAAILRRHEPHATFTVHCSAGVAVAVNPVGRVLSDPNLSFRLGTGTVGSRRRGSTRCAAGFDEGRRHRPRRRHRPMSAFMAHAGGSWVRGLRRPLGDLSTRRVLRPVVCLTGAERFESEGEALAPARRAARHRRSTTRREFRRYGSARLLTTSRPLTPRPTDRARERPSATTPPSESATFDRAKHRRHPTAARPLVYYIRFWAPSGASPALRLLLFLFAIISRYPLEGTASLCPRLVWRRRATRPLHSSPVAIAGMSFGPCRPMPIGLSAGGRARSERPRPPATAG